MQITHLRIEVDMCFIVTDPCIPPPNLHRDLRYTKQRWILRRFVLKNNTLILLQFEINMDSKIFKYGNECLFYKCFCTNWYKIISRQNE